MAWQEPKTNWNDKDAVRPSDMNRIEGNILELKKAATIDIADAAGNFTATNVEDALQELAGNVKNGKSSIANAIVAMGQSASGGDTFDTLAAKIRDISKDATAAEGNVLSGKTFYAGGAKKTGTMPNRGAVVITPSTQNQAIPQGYHNGQGYVKGDANLLPKNIVQGVSIFGVTGAAPYNAKLILDGNTTYEDFERGYTVGTEYTFWIGNGYITMWTRSVNNTISAVTSNMIDITDFTKLKARVSATSTEVGVGLAKQKNIAPASIPYKFNMIRDHPGTTFDISSITGSWYIILYIDFNYNASVTFNELILIK